MILHAPLALLAGLFILSITIAAPGGQPAAADPGATQTVAFLR
jgi:hypothetical protein